MSRCLSHKHTSKRVFYYFSDITSPRDKIVKRWERKQRACGIWRRIIIAEWETAVFPCFFHRRRFLLPSNAGEGQSKLKLGPVTVDLFLGQASRGSLKAAILQKILDLNRPWSESCTLLLWAIISSYMKLPPRTCDRTLVIVCKLYFSISESAANRQTEENETQRERERGSCFHGSGLCFERTRREAKQLASPCVVPHACS